MANPLFASCRLAHLPSTIRSFSTSLTRCAKSHDNALRDRHADLPPYPYGPARWYKQSNTGLYGGQTIRFGNNVGEESERRTRRSWHPNLITRNLRSTLLNTTIRVKLTTRVLRTIDKAGGIDAYLLGNKPARIKELGMEGWKLRCELLATSGYRDAMLKERDEMRRSNAVPDLETTLVEDVETIGNTPTTIQEPLADIASDAVVEVSTDDVSALSDKEAPLPVESASSVEEAQEVIRPESTKEST
ncbi:hypothetical protein K461DRAFT_277158 [Myriangium duriaei CBS 260.36]|uniref:Large ribosomal subunit protein bL28m n=1 Tax=Myriangium duriaei CBS 260.36 TaxID=1168546 RepID=A0A9P4J3H9_9PEZI|nr:hypothetical protein K461DRAFT_277158 [Myriangium duriaei CBS 260.36]